MNNLWQDFRYSLRMLRTQHTLSLVAILALSLGIGANTAIFSVINAVVLRPLPLPEADRLVMIWGNFLKLNIEHLSAKAAEYVDYRDQTTSFAQVAAFNNADLVLTGASQPARIPAARVTANLFTLLGAQAIHGRLIAPTDNEVGRDKVVLLSHGYWQKHFGGQVSAIGQTLQLDGESYTIIGVTPPGFAFPHESLSFAKSAELWTPLAFTTDQIAERRQPYYLNVIAKLQPGVTLAQARAEMSALAGRLEQQHRSYRGPGGADGGWRITVESLQEQIIGGSRRALGILFGAVGLVLLIACANAANLLLMRATVRERELAIRAALGASRARIIRQLLVESLLLALLGGALGLLLAWWGVDVLRALSPDNLPRVQEISIDGRVLGFTLLLALLTGLIFGLAPAWQAARPDLQRALKEGGPTARRGRHWLRGTLVVGEVAIAVLLLIGAGLLLRSFQRLARANPGIAANALLMAEINLPATKYAEPSQIASFYQQLAAKVAALPGVEGASFGTLQPLSGAAMNDPFSIEGRPLDIRNAPVAGWQRVGPHFFRALGIALVRGRDFTPRDDLAAPKVAIINETMARRYWPDEDPLGRRITLGAPRPDAPWAEIIGIVKDIPHRAIDSPAESDWYLPHLQSPARNASLFVRTTTDPASFAAAVRNQVLTIDKNQPVTIKTMNEVIAATVAPRRFNTLLLGLFAAVALLLAALGIYSVISYSVAQRTQEIGIRMALGAQARDIWRLVVGQGMMLVVVGIMLGLAAALALTRVMKSLLYEVSATDPLTFALIALVLAGVALLACWLPARRATKVDPLIALRYE